MSKGAMSQGAMSQAYRAIHQLRGWRQSLFIAALAERGYPNFALFAELTGRLDARPLRKALNQVWKALPDKELSPDYQKLYDAVEAQWPESEAFEGYGVYPAQDACDLVMEVLVSRLYADKQLAQAAAQRALQTVTQFVEANDAEGVEEDDLVRYLDRHPLVKQELRFQRELVEALRKTSYPSAESVRALRELAENGGVSNLGIALDTEEDA